MKLDMEMRTEEQNKAKTMKKDGLKSRIYRRKTEAAGILSMLVIPVAAFYLMECYSHNPLEEVRAWAQVFNILLFELLAWIVFFLTGRAKTALWSELILAMAYGIANSYVVRFRTNPIVPWDIFSWKTAASVASNYDFTPDMRMVFVSVIFVLGIIGLRFVRFRINTVAFWKRLFPAAALFLVLAAFAGKLQDEEFQTAHRLYPFLFTPVYMTDVNGMAVTFVMDLAYVSVEKPEGYQTQKAEALLADYEGTEEVQNPVEQETQETEFPNIIVVMNESFSDLAVLGEFQTNEDYMPFLHSLQKGAANTVTGYLDVSVCGGNTANSEFEFLTGNTMAFLPQGSIPYQQYITGETQALPGYLASLGYETVATHPYNASGWERNQVYPWLGFSDSSFINAYTSAGYVRKYVDDDSCVEKLIELYEEKEEGVPLFAFNVTMQNHGGYSDAYDNFTPDIKVDGVDNFALNQYLSLIRLSDESLEKLIHYFSGVEENTIVVFFGDHQPNDTIAAPILSLNGMSVNELTEEQLRLRYKVPYVIWANYDIEEQTNADTSLNYLAANVLELAGIPTTAYQNYLLKLEESYPAISAICVRKSEGTVTNATEEKDNLNDYQILQYYQLFDR